MIDSTRQLVFVLSETKPLPTVLTIFNAQGENRKKTMPKRGFFSFKTNQTLNKKLITSPSLTM